MHAAGYWSILLLAYVLVATFREIVKFVRKCVPNFTSKRSVILDGQPRLELETLVEVQCKNK